MKAATQNALFRILILNDPENSFPKSPHGILKLCQNRVCVSGGRGVNSGIFPHCTVWSLRPNRKSVKHSLGGADPHARPCLCLLESDLNQFLRLTVSLSTNQDQDWVYLRKLVGGLKEIKYIKCLGEPLAPRKGSYLSPVLALRSLLHQETPGGVAI